MDYFQVAIALLFLLALLDLSVGVSNDAVNFLNSAIGSRVASRRVILAVAGLGVIAGSLLSSGIMEVARSGIFNPQLFVFQDVMIIFLAVMLADVLLLDLFNTFGLPTSTTVSIVFELLGAAVLVAALNLIGNPDAGALVDYVNVERASLIVGGIGLSIVLAFIAGTLIQFFSRLLFTFQEKNHTAGIKIGWSAIAFTVISYFLIIKGLKGASFISPETLAWIQAQTVVLMLASLLVWGILMGLLHRVGIDVIAAVVMGGTFSLALAFASNDLVNFIGVPLAGLSAWQAWSDSGLAADVMTMEALAGPVRGNTAILLGAGLVMVITLWFSSKARSVTQTEVNLSRQDDGAERFRPGPVSRGIVRTAISAGETIARTVPAQWQADLAQRFAREKKRTADLKRPAFDTLRASVNLTVASILIVFATSLKLPLSTTFVSFMVAMGTSLADRAWGRDTAVYRLAGVFSVVGGWFVTAAAAFLLAATFALLIKSFGATAIAVLVAIAATALYHSHRHHQRRTQMDAMILASSPDDMDRDALTLRRHFVDSLNRNAEVVDRVLEVLTSRKRKQAKKLAKAVDADASSTRDTENAFVRRLNQLKPQIEPWLMNQLDVLSCERDLLQSSSTIAELAAEHVLNEHLPPSPAVASLLASLRERYATAFTAAASRISATDSSGQAATIRDIDASLEQLVSRILEDLYSGQASARSTTLMLGIALELRDLNRELRRAEDW